MKDIFDSFRAEAERLQETPSAAAWGKLEQKLAQNKNRAKIIVMRRWALAASVLLATGIIGLLATNLLKPKAQFASLGELDISRSATYNPSELNRHYALGHLNIEEGSSSKRLVAAFNYFYNESSTTNNAPLQRSKNTIEKVIKDTAALAQRNFDWLLGAWKGNIGNGTSVEEWRKSNQYTLQGKGFLVDNNDTLFMERMKLVNKGNEWYYVLQLNTFLKEEVYQLKYFNSQQAIFVNNEVKFPNQVILKKQSENGFSTIFLPNGKIELSPEQLDFISKRNVLMVDKSVRNLRRI